MKYTKAENIKKATKLCDEQLNCDECVKISYNSYNPGYPLTPCNIIRFLYGTSLGAAKRS